MLIFVEPQCAGFEHSEVNAALLVAASNAFSEESILFLAEPGHLCLVEEKAKGNARGDVSFQAITIPPPGTINLFRFPKELRLIDEIFSRAVTSGCHHVVFTSVTSAGLISIKLLLQKYPSVKCAVIPHGILESVIKRPSILPWHFVFWFRFALEYRNSPRLCYLLLGEPIRKRLSEAIPSVAPFLQAITLPMFFKEPSRVEPFLQETVTVGIFGVAHYAKGFDLFFRMASELTASEGEAAVRFLLIGHIGDKRLKEQAQNSPAVMPSPDQPLKRSDFDALAETINYAIYFYLPTSYRLTASGALFDAFSYVKPIIALRNPFFEYYFNEMGDIGYLCDSYDEMKAVLLQIVREKPVARYERQVANILAAREKISLEKIGSDLRAALER